MNKFIKAIAIFCAATAVSVSAQEITLDSTAAVVDNDIILTSELNQATALVKKSFAQRSQNIDDISARKAALEGLITDSLILQMAKAQGIELTDLQLDEILRQNAMSSNLEVDEYLKRLAPGLSLAQAREQFKQSLILNEVKRSRVRNRISISDTEVDLLAKNLKKVGSIEPRYHLSQIIVPLSARASAQSARKAENTVAHIRARLKQGDDFTSLAAMYTQGNLATQGGDLGYMPESQIPAPFLPALLKAKAGDVVGPFRSPYGLHLIKLIDVTHDAVTPIKEYDASHILLTTSIIFSDEAAYNQLNALRDKILSNDISFALAASKFSEDPGSAIQGGNLGYATPEKYDPRFAQALVALKEGEISMPVQSSFGWHLIKLNKIKLDASSDEAYKNKARDLIYRKLFAQEAIIWEQELRDNAFIKVQDPALVNAHIDIDQTRNAK